MRINFKQYFSAMVLFLCVSLAFAGPINKLSLTGVGDGATTANGADYVGPYDVSVNGTVVPAFCLDIDRDITLDETWLAAPTVLSVHSSNDDKTVALLIAAEAAGHINQVTAQLDIWGLVDATAAEADGLTQADILQLNVYELEAEKNVGGNAFYNNFTLETAIAGTQSGSDGTAQDFIFDPSPSSPTPEPASLVLFGTGLVGAAGAARRRFKV